MPLELASSSIIECRNAPHTVLNLVHPQPISLENICSVVAKELALPLCSYKDWLQVLEDRAFGVTDVSAMDTLPALKAMDFFRTAHTLSIFDTEAKVCCGNAMNASETLRNAPPLTEEDVKGWLAYWDAAGLLTS